MSTNAVRKRKETPDLRLVPGGLGPEEEVSKKCDAVMAAIREVGSDSARDIPPARGGNLARDVRPRQPSELPIDQPQPDWNHGPNEQRQPVLGNQEPSQTAPAYTWDHPIPPEHLAGFFEKEADWWREFGLDQPALVLDRVAAKVAESFRFSNQEPLTLEQAEVESGYTRSHLRRLMRNGVVPFTGEGMNIRILRMHLPRKPGYRVDEGRADPVSSRLQAARAVALGEE